MNNSWKLYHCASVKCLPCKKIFNRRKKLCKRTLTIHPCSRRTLSPLLQFLSSFSSPIYVFEGLKPVIISNSGKLWTACTFYHQLGWRRDIRKVNSTYSLLSILNSLVLHKRMQLQTMRNDWWIAFIYNLYPALESPT